MNFTLSEEHEALRDVAKNFLAKEVSHSKLLVPGATVEQSGYDQLWPKIVELGWPGIVIPERFGGLGMTYIDLAMIVGEMGRFLAAAPLFGTLAGCLGDREGRRREAKVRSSWRGGCWQTEACFRRRRGTLVAATRHGAKSIC